MGRFLERVTLEKSVIIPFNRHPSTEPIRKAKELDPKMDINENPKTGQDPKIYVMSQSGNIYYFFRSQITTSDKRYTLIKRRAAAGWKDPEKYEVSLSPPSRKNLNVLILEM